MALDTQASSFQVDTYAAAVKALRAAGTAGIQRLVIIAFVDRWSPPAVATAAALEQMRQGGHVHYASVFIVDATADRDAAHEHGVLCTPALLFFWDGQQASVRRPAWEDDDKFSGAAPMEDDACSRSFFRCSLSRAIRARACINHANQRNIVPVASALQHPSWPVFSPQLASLPRSPYLLASTHWTISR